MPRHYHGMLNAIPRPRGPTTLPQPARAVTRRSAAPRSALRARPGDTINSALEHAQGSEASELHAEAWLDLLLVGGYLYFDETLQLTGGNAASFLTSF